MAIYNMASARSAWINHFSVIRSEMPVDIGLQTYAPANSGIIANW